MTKPLWCIGLLGALVALGVAVRLTPPQILAVTIFSSFILGTLFYWPCRLAFALIGMTLLLAGRVIDIPHLIEFANMDIILFLIGMMIVIGFLEERRFFEVVMERLLAAIGPRPRLLLAAMMGLAMLSAALVDEVTSILFMTTLMLHLTTRCKVAPLPFVMLMVFATNIGSSATVVGNPIGVLIALRAGLTFTDFLRWATPISLATLALIIPIGFCYFRRPIAALADGLAHAHGQAIAVEQVPAKEFRLALTLFLVTITALIAHHALEEWLRLEHNTLLLGIPFLMAGIALLLEGENARRLFEKRVDWWTLAFFILLFASVGTLRYVGVTDRIAAGLTAVAGHHTIGMLALIMVVAAVLTALLDNILVVATFVPILYDLGTAGLTLAPLWWGLLFAGTLGGNATMIGSTANIVAIGVLERHGETLRFADWLKPGLIITIPTLLLAFLLLVLQLPRMP